MNTPEAAKELFRALIPLKIRWTSQASVEMTRDPEMMDLMARSGCIGHVVGFESIDARSLRAMKKAPNLMGGYQGYEQQVEVLRDHGLQTWAAFTIGHDRDTPDSIKLTVDFALENKFAVGAFNILMPYPNTALYKRLEAEGRLLYDGKWWLHPDYRFNHAAFRPELMTPDQLTEECRQARTKFNSHISFIRRAFDFKTNMRSPYRLALYLTYVPLMRKTVGKKYGMKLGLH